MGDLTACEAEPVSRDAGVFGFTDGSTRSAGTAVRGGPTYLNSLQIQKLHLLLVWFAFATGHLDAMD